MERKFRSYLLLCSLLTGTAWAQDSRETRFVRTAKSDCRSYYLYSNSRARTVECFYGQRESNGNFRIDSMTVDGRAQAGTVDPDILTSLYCRPHGFRRAAYQRSAVPLTKAQLEDTLPTTLALHLGASTYPLYHVRCLL